jgi:GNAT superfamily N-acetyltransferase
VRTHDPARLPPRRADRGSAGDGPGGQLLELSSDARGFLDVAARFLAENEAENTIVLGAALSRMHRPKSDGLMVVARDGDILRLVAMMTPPHALALSAGDPEAVPCLVEALREARTRPPGVSGIEPMAEGFAAVWTNRERAVAERGLQMILYRSNRVATPENIPGELRTAAILGVDWLAAWQRRFAEQTGLSAAERAADMQAVAAARVSRGEMVFLGRPRAAGIERCLRAHHARRGRRRINAVVTLEQERGKGYASTCVAALSRRLLDRGWRHCLIFADRDNPMTIRMYPRLGYKEIAAFATIGFRYDQ